MKVIKGIISKLASTIGYRIVQNNSFGAYRFFREAITADAIRIIEPTLVIDVGGNEGQFYRALRDLGYLGPVATFEPIPALARQLLQNEDPRWHIFCCALGSRSGIADFNVMEGSDFSSFLEPERSDRFLGNKVVDIISVEMKRLDDLRDELVEIGDISKIFLKIDAQGFDLEVLSGIGSLRQYIVGIMTELSVQQIYKGMPNWLETLTVLDAMGFEPVGFIPVSTVNERVVEFDCILMPKFDDPESRDDH